MWQRTFYMDKKYANTTFYTTLCNNISLKEKSVFLRKCRSVFSELIILPFVNSCPISHYSWPHLRNKVVANEPSLRRRGQFTPPSPQIPGACGRTAPTDCGPSESDRLRSSRDEPVPSWLSVPASWTPWSSDDRHGLLRSSRDWVWEALSRLLCNLIRDQFHIAV